MSTEVENNGFGSEPSTEKWSVTVVLLVACKLSCSNLINHSNIMEFIVVGLFRVRETKQTTRKRLINEEGKA